MSTRHLFLPFLIALAGFVSCDEIQPDVAVGCVTVDKEQFCALTSVIGGETEGNHKWAFYDDGKVRVNVSGYRCRCDDNGHIPFHLSVINIDLPGIATMQIPLEERAEGDNYLSGNKSVSGVRLNHYKLSDDGRHLEIDLSIPLYRETKGDIRVLYKGATNVKATRR